MVYTQVTWPSPIDDYSVIDGFHYQFFIEMSGVELKCFDKYVAYESVSNDLKSHLFALKYWADKYNKYLTHAKDFLPIHKLNSHLSMLHRMRSKNNVMIFVTHPLAVESCEQ